MGLLVRELLKVFWLYPLLGTNTWMPEVSCWKPRLWVKQRHCWLSAQVWPLRPCSPAWHQGPACHCSRMWGESLLARAAVVLSDQGCTEWLPGIVAPWGAKLICVSKHPPPLKAKAPAQPLPAAGMLLCGPGHFLLPLSVLPLISCCLLQLGLWLFSDGYLYIQVVSDRYNLCLSRSIKAALARGQLQIYKYPSTPPPSLQDVKTPSH